MESLVIRFFNFHFFIFIMRTERAIKIKSPKFVKLRNEFRSLLRLCLEEKVSLLRSKSANSRKINNLELSHKFQQEIDYLHSIHRKSICLCHFCGSIEKNMVFNPDMEHWICKDCDLHFEEISMLRSRIPLKFQQIVFFIERLSITLDINKKGSNCDGTFSYSRFILDEMGVEKENLNGFLELCRNYGGNCDCEILFNAKDQLLKNFV